MGQQLEQAGDAGRKMSMCSSSDEEHVGEGREHFVESNREHQDIDVNLVINTELKDHLLTVDSIKGNSQVAGKILKIHI